MELIQDGAVTAIAIAAAALVWRRQFAASRKDASPKCSNCASSCDDQPARPASHDDTTHPLILVRRPPR